MSLKTNNVKRYSKSYKEDFVNRVRNGSLSLKEARDRYGIGTASLSRWYREFGHVYGTVEYIDLPFEEMGKLERNKAVKQLPELDASTLSNDAAELQRQIRELHEQLHNMQLRAEVAELTIEIAERDLGLEIRKKFGAKSSPK